MKIEFYHNVPDSAEQIKALVNENKIVVLDFGEVSARVPRQQGSNPYNVSAQQGLSPGYSVLRLWYLIYDEVQSNGEIHKTNDSGRSRNKSSKG